MTFRATSRVVRLAYEVIAGELECQVFGARLAPSVRVTPRGTTHPASRWSVSIVTRCNGRRRHRHYADAVLAADLLLGPLARRGPRA